jgi:hypothetical protein
MMKHVVISLTTRRVHMRTLSNLTPLEEHRAGKIETCVTSTIAKMNTAESKTDVRSVSTLNRSDVKRGTMTILVPIMTNLIDSAVLKEDTMQEELKPFPTT